MQDAHLVLGSDLDDSIEIFQNALYGQEKGEKEEARERLV